MGISFLPDFKPSRIYFRSTWSGFRPVLREIRQPEMEIRPMGPEIRPHICFNFGNMNMPKIAQVVLLARHFASYNRRVTERSGWWLVCVKINMCFEEYCIVKHRWRCSRAFVLLIK